MNNARWIWYPGDFEQHLMLKVSSLRYERDVIQPIFWRADDCFHIVSFEREYEFEKDCCLHIKADGEVAVTVDVPGTFVYDNKGIVRLVAGKHYLKIQVCNLKDIPSLYVESDDVDGFCTDGAWTVTANDHIFVNAACCEAFGSKSPNKFKLAVKPVDFAAKEVFEDGTLYDFGAEMMGSLSFKGLTAQAGATLCIAYGESRDEALDFAHCELTEEIPFKSGAKNKTYTTKIPKAFRYIYVFHDNNRISYGEFGAKSHYLPLINRASFHTSDTLLNNIYDTAVYTLSLNAREFLFDGIKRDRWVWGGDIFQSSLFCYYSFFDLDLVKRSILAVRGKDPMATHINHIMDYTFFWICGFKDYLDYTGDSAFVESTFDKIISTMEFCIGRTNQNGLMEGLKHDWVFVDWVHHKLDNSGEVCVENMLYYKALSVMSELSRTYRPKLAERYAQLAGAVLAQINGKFWDEQRGMYHYSLKDGVPGETETRHPGIFAVYLDICTGAQRDKVIKNMLLSDKLPAITNPYMRFFELTALCKAGMHSYALEQIRSYWGGMLDAGATSFWEYFDQSEQGAEHYVMYGRKFGRSLCHAWGSTPLYILGRFFAGVTPDAEDAEKFICSPNPCDVASFTAEIPLKKGSVVVSLKHKKLTVQAKNSEGAVVINGKHVAVAKNGTVTLDFA